MIKFTKKIEYSLIALRYIANNSDKIVTAKEISTEFNIPSEMLAKILQKLKKENLLRSSQGINGGYKLNKNLNKISLSELVDIVEGKSAIVECLHEERFDDCEIIDKCSIRAPINKIQSELLELLKTKMISDFI